MAQLIRKLGFALVLAMAMAVAVQGQDVESRAGEKSVGVDTAGRSLFGRLSQQLQSGHRKMHFGKRTQPEASNLAELSNSNLNEPIRLLDLYEQSQQAQLNRPLVVSMHNLQSPASAEDSFELLRPSEFAGLFYESPLEARQEPKGSRLSRLVEGSSTSRLDEPSSRLPAQILGSLLYGRNSNSFPGLTSFVKKAEPKDNTFMHFG